CTPQRLHSSPTRRSSDLLSVVLLPSELGRQSLTLPPLPIAMARASGEVITVCTSEHSIAVDDPTANTPNAEPKPNPAPSRQTERSEEHTSELQSRENLVC